MSSRFAPECGVDVPIYAAAATTTTTTPDLAASLEDLNAVGAAHSPSTASSAFPDTIARADAMLVQVKSLQSAITSLAGLGSLGSLHERRLANVPPSLTGPRWNRLQLPPP